MITLQERDSRAIQCATSSWLLVGDIREMLQDHLDEEAIGWLQPILDALIDAMREQARAATPRAARPRRRPAPRHATRPNRHPTPPTRPSLAPFRSPPRRRGW